MLLHDIIKIKLSEAGYLPGYPPHLISDEEMCWAFLPYEYDESDPESGYDDCMAAQLNYFRDTYPVDKFTGQCTQNALQIIEDSYKELVVNIAYHLNKLKKSKVEDFLLPDWVYSYMLDAVITIGSPIKDKHDLFVLLDTDNLYDEFDYACALACRSISDSWLKKLPKSMREHRSPTIFGAPHVIKSLRVASDV